MTKRPTGIEYKDLDKDSDKDTQSSNDIHLLFDEIDTDNAKDAIEWILDANFSKTRPKCLNLVINSQGGDMNSAYAIIDIIESSNIPVRTIGLGQIASAGLMIFLAGQAGERVLTPNTSIMSHQYGWGSAGKHHELIAIQKEFDLTFQRMLNHYKKHTKLSIPDIKKYLLPSEDVYLSAEEALKYKICDRIALLK